MVNKDDFIKRLEEILHFYDLSASLFADKITVQRSSISHLLKGRNNPSLDFVSKVVKTFPEVDLYWLLYGEGVFPQISKPNIPPIEKTNMKVDRNPLKEKGKTIHKIVFFYDDGSFDTFENN